MRNPFTEGHHISSLSVKHLVAVCEACSAFQDGDMFILSLMNMQGRAIAGVGYNFDQRI